MYKAKDGSDLPDIFRVWAEEKFNACVKKAEEYLKKELKPIKLLFGISGNHAGIAKTIRKNGIETYEVHLNSLHLLVEAKDMLEDTIPHEVAHIIVMQNWGSYCNNRRVMPHGQEWKFVMSNIFKVAPKRCHSYSKMKIETFKRSIQ